MPDRIYTVLAIDGGGVRGLIPAHLLEYLERQIRVQLGTDDVYLADFFDFFAGTSTGGILACGYLKPESNTNRPQFSAADMKQSYLQNAGRIFDADIVHNLTSGWGIASPKYPAAAIEECLHEYFADTLLSDLLKPCLITSYDLLRQRTLSLCQHLAGASEGFNFFVRDVVRATTSAPAYFPAATLVSRKGNRYLCTDGGLYAFNPALSAYAEIRRMNPSTSARSMYIVSLGTGIERLKKSEEQIKQWGSFEWSKMINDISCDSSAYHVDLQLRQIFTDQHHHYHRLSPKLYEKLPEMDWADPRSLQRILDIADRFLQKNKEHLDSIASFLTRRHKDILTSPYAYRLSSASFSSDLDSHPGVCSTPGEATAWNCNGSSTSYAQMRTASLRIAAWLSHRTTHAPVILLLPASPAREMILQAAIQSGRMAVSIAHENSDQLSFHLRRGGANVLFACQPSLSALPPDLPPELTIVIVSETDLHTPGSPSFSTFASHLLGSWSGGGNRVRLAELLRFTAPADTHSEAAAAFSFLQYTQNKSGQPRTVLSTHRSVIAAVRQLRSVLPPELTPHTIVNTLPPHLLLSSVIVPLLAEQLAACRPIGGDWTVKKILAATKKHPHCLLIGDNQIFAGITASAEFFALPAKLHGVAVSFRDPMELRVLRRWEEHTQTPLQQLYCPSEAHSPISATRRGNGSDESKGTLGHPLPATEVMVVDQHHRALPNGQPGMLCARSPQITSRPEDCFRITQTQQHSFQWLNTHNQVFIDHHNRIVPVAAKP